MLQFSLSWPPSALRPNAARRRYWAANATAAALYKSVVAIELREQGVAIMAMPSRLAVTLRFCPPTRRTYDLDGSLSACKSALDQLADMLGVDDACFEPITLCRGPVLKGGRVEVTITEDA